MEGGKLILVLNITVNRPIWSRGIKRISPLKLFPSLLSCMVVKYGGVAFLKNLGGRLSKSRSGVAIRLYENVIAKFKNNHGWLTNINCNTGVK